MASTSPAGAPHDPDSLRRVLGEAFDLAATNIDLARSIYEQLAGTAIGHGLPWDALSQVHHELLVERIKREPERTDHWSRAAAVLMASLAESLQARLLSACAAEEQRLADSEARFRVLFESSPHQMWGAKPDGSLEYANPHMRAYFAAQEGPLPAGTVDASVHPDDLDAAHARWKQALSEGSSFEAEMRLRRADGEYHWHLIRAQPLRDAQGRILRWFGVNFDIEDLKRAQESAEHSTRMKSAFLSSMSHEIRTPMNAVLGFSSLLADTTLDTRQHEFLTSIRASGEHLLGVINNILDFSKMEAGLLELDVHPFALRPLAEAALDIVSPNAADQGVELGCLIREHVPAGLVADEGRLRQVFVNLLGNAVKFTPRGEVVLTADARPTGEPGEWEFHFTVRDTGIGIPPDVLPRLFREFMQGESSTQRRYGGTGLGLAISKRIVELHGGRIWAESHEGRGSTFHVVLPAKEAPGLPARRAAADLTGRRLLAVDDSAANLEILQLQAQGWGMSVRAARDPREALRWVREGESFDIAVVDHRMPFMDGVALAGALRELPGGRHMPIVMLSSLGARVRSPHLPIVLTKPVHQSALQQALHSAMRLDAQAIAAAQAAPEGTDLSGICVLLAEDNLLNQRVARLLLDRLGLSADVAFNGRDAVEAVARKKYDVVLMDVEMPEMDGLVAAREIVRRFGDARPWLIAVTAQALQGDRERCLAAGFDDYLSKPLSPPALGAALARVPRAASTPAEAGTCPDFNAAAFERMRESYGDVAVAEIVDALEVDLPQQSAEFMRSRANGDSRTFSRVAHTLKSSSRMFGAEHLANAWQAIESSSRDGRIDQAAADAAFARYNALVAYLSAKAKIG